MASVAAVTRVTASVRAQRASGVAAVTRAACLVGAAGLLAAALPGPAMAAAPAQCRNPPGEGSALPATEPRDPMIARLGLGRAWELSTGAGVTVAVVDSGVDGRQPKLSPALARGVDLVTTQVPPGYQQLAGVARDCGNDGQPHGTPVAGLIAARREPDDRMVGVAPDARIAPVRIVDGIGQVSDAELAAAIRIGANLGRVLNLSFALPVDRPMTRQAVQYALSRDVVVVAAAGNESSGTAQKYFPAAYPGVLAVAGLKADGTPMQESNRGPWIGIAAPGERLLAPASGSGFVRVSGTSFAAAVVSGTAALVRSRFPSIRAAEVVRRLTATAVPLGVARDDRVGAGIVDPFAALTARTVGAGPTTTAPSTSSIAVQPLPARPASVSQRWGRPLAVAGMLALAAVLAYLGRLAVRAAARRRWRAGGPPQAGEPERAPEPPDVQLV